MHIDFELIIAHDCKFVVQTSPSETNRFYLLLQECTGYSHVDIDRYGVYYLNMNISFNNSSLNFNDLYKRDQSDVGDCVLLNGETGEITGNLLLLDSGRFTTMRLEFQTGETIEFAVESVKKTVGNVVDTLDFWTGSLYSAS